MCAAIDSRSGPRIFGSVGAQGRNDPVDVRAVQRKLQGLGFYGRVFGMPFPQRRYDQAYTQCMYGKGHRVAVSGHYAPQARRYAPPPPRYNYPPPPPPPGYRAPPPTGSFVPPPGSAPGY